MKVANKGWGRNLCCLISDHQALGQQEMNIIVPRTVCGWKSKQESLQTTRDIKWLFNDFREHRLPQLNPKRGH